MLKNYDAFAKPRQELRQERSASRGLVTVIASFVAGCLFLGQIYTYITGVTRHSLHLSESTWVPVPALDSKPISSKGRIPLHIYISFPHLACTKLDLTHDGLSYKDDSFREIHGKTSTKVTTTTITKSEYEKATGTKNKNTAELRNGCTFKAHFDIPKVGGTFTVGMNGQAWAEVTPMLMMGAIGMGFGRNMMGGFGGMNKDNNHNVTHYIHSITFGESFPLSKNPLEDDAHIIVNEEGGIALANVNVKLIPTQYTRFFLPSEMYQLSVTEHTVHPATMAKQGGIRYLPGLAVQYDFSPLAVHHVEARDNIFVFLSSLIGIVGGVFVTTKLVTGFVVHGAEEIAKKMD